MPFPTVNGHSETAHDQLDKPIEDEHKDHVYPEYDKIAGEGTCK